MAPSESITTTTVWPTGLRPKSSRSPHPFLSGNDVIVVDVGLQLQVVPHVQEEVLGVSAFGAARLPAADLADVVPQQAEVGERQTTVPVTV